MFCPKCGRMNNDEYLRCKGCGELLHSEELRYPDKKKKSVIKSLAALLVSAAVMVGASAALLASCETSPPESEDSAGQSVSF